jgi:ankyrin repeat protein
MRRHRERVDMPTAADATRYLQRICAAGQDDAAAGRATLAAGADVQIANHVGSTPLHQAVGNGHLRLATVLLDGGAERDARNLHGQTPLHMAAIHGRRDIIHLLVEAGADVGARDGQQRTPLHMATEQTAASIFYGDSHARALLTAGADPLALDAQRLIADPELKTTWSLAHDPSTSQEVLERLRAHGAHHLVDQPAAAAALLTMVTRGCGPSGG